MSQRIKSVLEVDCNVATSWKRKRKNVITPPNPPQHIQFAKVTTVPPLEGRRHQKEPIEEWLQFLQMGLPPLRFIYVSKKFFYHIQPYFFYKPILVVNKSFL